LEEAKRSIDAANRSDLSKLLRSAQSEVDKARRTPGAKRELRELERKLDQLKREAKKREDTIDDEEHRERTKRARVTSGFVDRLAPMNLGMGPRSASVAPSPVEPPAGNRSRALQDVGSAIRSAEAVLSRLESATLGEIASAKRDAQRALAHARSAGAPDTEVARLNEAVKKLQRAETKAQARQDGLDVAAQSGQADERFVTHAAMALSALGSATSHQSKDSGSDGTHGPASASHGSLTDAVAGEKGAWNTSLYAGRTDVTVRVDGNALYATDTLGRTVGARAVLSQIWEPYEEGGDRTERRNPDQQRGAGRPDRVSMPGRPRDSDDGGHIFGTLFGGAGEGINIVAMHSEHNKGTYRALERQFEDHIRSGGVVDVEFSATYHGDSARPDSFSLTYDLGEGPRTVRFDQ
jgi:hypothetical protein